TYLLKSLNHDSSVYRTVCPTATPRGPSMRFDGWTQTTLRDSLKAPESNYIGCRRQPTRMHLCPSLPPYGPALTFHNRPNLKQNLMGSTVCVPTSQQCRPLPSRHFRTSAQSAQHG